MTRLRVIGFLASAARASKEEAISAICSAASDDGHDATVSSQDEYSDCDVAIVWGEASDKTSVRHQFVDRVRSNHAGPFVVVETPFLGRAVTMRQQNSFLKLFSNKTRKPDYSEFRVGIGGVTPKTGDFFLDDLMPDRHQLLSRRLNLPALSAYRTKGQHILLIGQKPNDASLLGLDIGDWLLETATQISSMTERPLVVRPHPRMEKDDLDALCRDLLRSVKGVQIDVGTPMSTALQNAWVTVTYSSGAAIDALCAGIPSIALSDASFAWEVSGHSLEEIENPPECDREVWLNRLAHCQWSAAELRNGLLWSRLARRLQYMVAGLRAETRDAARVPGDASLNDPRRR